MFSKFHTLTYISIFIIYFNQCNSFLNNFNIPKYFLEKYIKKNVFFWKKNQHLKVKEKNQSTKMQLKCNLSVFV